MQWFLFLPGETHINSKRLFAVTSVAYFYSAPGIEGAVIFHSYTKNSQHLGSKACICFQYF